MKMKPVLVAASLLALGCSGDAGLLAPVPPDLLNSPSTITVDGAPIILGASIIAAPNLELTAILGTTNLTSWPQQATTGRVWVVHRGVAWTSRTEADPVPLPLRIGAIAVIASSTGPSWPVGDSVDVVMEVLDGHGSTQLLRAPRTPILSGRQLMGRMEQSGAAAPPRPRYYAQRSALDY